MRSFLSEFRLYICNFILNVIPFHSVRLFYYRRVMKFIISTNTGIHMKCVFDSAGGLTIGENSVINAKCRIDTRGGVYIGNNVSISSECVILTADHDMNSDDFQGRQKKVIIEDYVWIGTRAMIMPGVVLQEGCVIAAGSVVTKNVNSYEVVGGVPARFLKKRSPNGKLSYKLSYLRLFH